MQVFKVYFKIAKKQLRGAVFYVVIFGALMFMMSMQTSEEAGGRFQTQALDITVIDEDKSEASRALTSYLGGIHNLVELPDTQRETLFDNLYYNWISYVLVIPLGYEERLSELDTDGLVQSSKMANSARGYFVDEQIDEYLSSVTIYLSSGYTLEEALGKTADILEKGEAPEVLQFETSAGKSVNTMMIYFFQYFPYIFLSVMIMGMGPVLIVFYRRELNSRMQCSALSSLSVNVQLAAGCIVHTLAFWILFMLGALAIYGSSDLFSEKGLLLIGNSLAFLPVGTSITLLLGTAVSAGVRRNLDSILNMAANVIGLGMSFLCGIFVPQYLLGDGVLKVAHFLPAYWYVRAGNMIGGLSDEVMSYTTYRTCIGMQLLFFAAISAVYLAVSGQRKYKQVQFSGG